MISYELSMSMSVVGVLILAGHDLAHGDRRRARARWWFVVPQIVGFVIYIITAVAETNRAPFDLVEAETELVARLPHRVLGLALRTVLHRRVPQHDHGLVPGDAAVLRRLEPAFRADDTPSSGSSWFVVKAALFLFFYIWLRTTLPRLRYDRLMAFGWKVLLPVATLNLVVTAVVVAVWG